MLCLPNCIFAVQLVAHGIVFSFRQIIITVAAWLLAVERADRGCGEIVAGECSGRNSIKSVRRRWRCLISRCQYFNLILPFRWMTSLICNRDDCTAISMLCAMYRTILSTSDLIRINCEALMPFNPECFVIWKITIAQGVWATKWMNAKRIVPTCRVCCLLRAINRFQLMAFNGPTLKLSRFNEIELNTYTHRITHAHTDKCKWLVSSYLMPMCVVSRVRRLKYNYVLSFNHSHTANVFLINLMLSFSFSICAECGTPAIMTTSSSSYRIAGNVQRQIQISNVDTYVLLSMSSQIGVCQHLSSIWLATRRIARRSFRFIFVDRR